MRLGRAVTVAPALRGQCLEALVERTPGVREVQKQLLLCRAGEGAAQEGLGRQLARERSEAAVSVLRAADVVVASLVGAGHEQLTALMQEHQLRFSTVVIDEATQAVEPACLIPLHQGARRLVLVGDQCQLPPTVTSVDARRAGLGRSLFERLVLGGLPPQVLTLQFRIHPALAAFSSQNFYNGCVASFPLPAARPPPPGFPWPDAALPMAWVHVRRNAALGDEGSPPDSASYHNHPEVRVLAEAVVRLIAAGVPPGEIGVMAPYSAQVNCLNEAINHQLSQAIPGAVGLVECASVDAFQGREKEVMLMSTVRSNAVASLGFLTDWRRLNVALTRARSGLILVGDAVTLQADRYWLRLLEHCRGHGVVMDADALLALFEAEPLQAVM